MYDSQPLSKRTVDGNSMNQFKDSDRVLNYGQINGKAIPQAGERLEQTRKVIDFAQEKKDADVSNDSSAHLLSRPN